MTAAATVLKTNLASQKGHHVRNIRLLASLSAAAIAWAPLLIGPVAAWIGSRDSAPWVSMSWLAATVYGGLKWGTWCTALEQKRVHGAWRSLGYLLAWPGMDAVRFCDPTMRPVQPRAKDWWSAAARLLAGIAIIWTAGLPLTMDMPAAAGWLGILGFLFAFHFGLFQLLALGWQQLGVAAEPLMNSPLRARTVSEFWSSRWNRAFRDIAHPLVFRPVARRFGVALATVAGFLASGLIHDLVISLPARSEFGLPTLYFLIQPAAILAERSAWGRRLRFAAGAGERLFVAVVVLAPAGLLFHPPFIRQVVLPMLAATHGG